MISLEELKRLHGESNLSRDMGQKKYVMLRNEEDLTIQDARLACYLRNHCEEIIKILEERQ